MHRPEPQQSELAAQRSPLCRQHTAGAVAALELAMQALVSQQADAEAQVWPTP
jgi:hypothetical protein